MLVPRTFASAVLVEEVTGAVHHFPRDFRVVPPHTVYLTRVVLQVKVDLVAVVVCIVCTQMKICWIVQNTQI